MTIQDLNKQLSTINRIVVHPKYRTIGLGAKLISETLLLTGTPYVELIAVMAKYSPFAEKAGMRNIAVQHSEESFSQVTNVLLQLKFDLQLLCSERYVENKLRSLDEKQIILLKNAFLGKKHPRFKRLFAAGQHQPFGKTFEYNLAVEKANLIELAQLIKTVGILIQSKVYLFWADPRLVQ